MAQDEHDPGTTPLPLDAIATVASDLAPLLEQSVQAQHLDAFGRELPNPTPLAPPIGYVKHKSIAETVRDAIRQASLEARQAGAETEAEANDFDVGEDFDPSSPWEHPFEPDPEMEAMLALHSRPPTQQPAEAPAPPATPPAPLPGVPPAK